MGQDTDEWIDECMDGWVGVRTGGWMNGKMDALTDGWAGGQVVDV